MFSRHALHSLSRKRLPLGAVLVGGVFLLVLAVMVVLNRHNLGLILTQFASLWAIEKNRPVIVGVLLKTLLPPLLLAALAGVAYWLVATARAYYRQSTVAGQASVPAREAVVPLQLPVTPLPAVLMGAPGVSSSQPSKETTTGAPAPAGSVATLPWPPVTVTLLKEVQMTLHTPNGRLSMVVPLKLNAKRVQLLAYIGWLRGGKVNREQMLEHVFGHGRSDEDRSPQKLADAFDDHRKLIRRDLRKAIAQFNEQVEGEVIAPDLDIFENGQLLWWLAPVCRVLDLEELEKQHLVIEKARKDGLLVDVVPEYVKNACDALMRAYAGDFLGDLIEKHPYDFEPLGSSWARKPFTLYRDYYLQALWYAAEYELRRGQLLGDEGTADEAQGRTQREHYGKAAELFYAYAMYACNSRFDTKVTFKSSREQGERVSMSELAIQYSVKLYSMLGSIHSVDQFYTAYYKHMKRISAEVWSPSERTQRYLQDAKAQTNALRLPNRVTSHEPLPQPLEATDRS